MVRTGAELAASPPALRKNSVSSAQLIGGEEELAASSPPTLGALGSAFRLSSATVEPRAAPQPYHLYPHHHSLRNHRQPLQQQQHHQHRQHQHGHKSQQHQHQQQLLRSSRGTFGRCLALALFVIGLIVCVTSILCILLLPSFVANQIAKRLVLRNNSLLLERWARPNVPMYFKVWVFDVKNARELLETRGAKPQLEEVGPFVFDLRRQKDVVSFAGDNLYYTEKKVYHFNRELSCCAINRTVTIPNIPLVAVVDRALGYNLPLVGRLIPRLINRAIQSLREQLFVRKQVGELLFDGYEVDLLRMVSRIGSLVGLPQQSQRFALLKGRNDTWRPEQDGVWAINTGARDRAQFGRVASWNSYRQLPFWSGAQCNAINGSDGTLFPPPISKREPLYIFNQELCRTVNLVYERPSDVRSIGAYRFVLNPLNFAHTVEPAASPGQQRQQPAPRGSILAKPSSPPLNPLVVSAGGAAGGAGSSAAPEDARAAGEPRSRPAIVSHGPRAKPLNRQRSTRVRRAEAPSEQQQQQQQTASQQQNLRNQEKFVQAAQLVQRDGEPTRRNPQTCFCDRKSTSLRGVNVCELDGLIDLSKCSKQAQVIFGSMPHFSNADPRLLRQVDGLQPNATRHTTYLDIEPNTGLVLGGKRRVQLNLLIKRNNQVDGFENINDMLVPVVWFEESAQIPEESARKFRALYTDRIRLVNLTLISLLAASVVLLAIDARLLFASHNWRQLSLGLVVARAPPPPPADSKAHDADGRKRRKLFRRPGALAADLAADHPAADSRRFAVSSDEALSSSSSSAGELNQRELARLRQHQRQMRRLQRANDDETDGNLTKRSDSPLLNSSTSTTDSECSASSSPELRKWAPPAAQASDNHVSKLLIVSEPRQGANQ